MIGYGSDLSIGDPKPLNLLREFQPPPFCAPYVSVSDHVGAHLAVGANGCKEMVGSGAHGP